MKLRCLLVDDEPRALKVLQAHISNVNGVEVAGLCKNAVEALDVLHQKAVDVIFLDIKMPKILGTEFLRGLDHPPKVVFVTAYRDFAVEGYELDAVDYLLKPVSFERFLRSISKLKRLMGLQAEAQQEEYKTNLNAFVYLKVDKNMQKIFLNDIIYIESWKDYVKVFLCNAHTVLVKQSISSMENMLSEHKFLRVHRSYMVSMEKISGYNGVSVKINATEIPIGRLYKQTVLEQINGH
jgi:DNA-binding LytR/AlgR family response regulator